MGETASVSHTNVRVRDDASERERFPSISLRYLGFGMFWGWLFALSFGSSSSALATGAHALLSFQTLPVGLAVMAASLVGFSLVRGGNPRSPALAIPIAACAILGPACSVAIGVVDRMSGTGAVVVSLIGWVAAGVVGACMTWLWAVFYGSIDLRRASVYLAASMTLGTMLYFVLTFLMPLPRLAATAALPTVCALLFFKATRGQTGLVPTQNVRSLAMPSAVARILVLVAIYGLAYGLLLGLATQRAQLDFVSRLVLLVAGATAAVAALASIFHEGLPASR